MKMLIDRDILKFLIETAADRGCLGSLIRNILLDDHIHYNRLTFFSYAHDLDDDLTNMALHYIYSKKQSIFPFIKYNCC